MRKKKLFFILIIPIVAYSCSVYDQQSRKIRSANRRFETKHILLLGCAHELTKGTCIYFWHNNHFSIESSYGRYSKDYFAGTYIVKGDTVFPTFYKDIKPNNKNDYFLKDSSNKYILIYPSIIKENSLKFLLKKPNSIL